MTKPVLLVLAAGMGSRFGGLKQIRRFGPGGETLLEYSIYDALRAGFEKVVIVLRQSFADEFRQSVLQRASGKADISFVFQELDSLPAGFTLPAGRVKPWGTAHAVMMAESEIAAPFAVINADDFYGPDSYRIIFEFLSRPRVPEQVEEYCIVDYMLKHTLSESGSVARGICQVDGQGYLMDIAEHKKIFRNEKGIFSQAPDNTLIPLTGDEHVSMNLMGFEPSFFSHLKSHFVTFLRQHIDNPDAEFYLPTALALLIHSGKVKVKVIPTRERWFGVTYQEDSQPVMDNLLMLIRKGVYPDSLWR